MFPPTAPFLVPIEEMDQVFFPVRVLEGGPISTSPDLVDETRVRGVPNVGIGERIRLTFGTVLEGFNKARPPAELPDAIRFIVYEFLLATEAEGSTEFLDASAVFAAATATVGCDSWTLEDLVEGVLFAQTLCTSDFAEERNPNFNVGALRLAVNP